ncbi:FadR/GntR family transcriptional regulator [Anaerobacillus sp. MEB173]|uniref:FadR/GntR family transcriptional regulator n=1 Tax=Anaerobacillus sp. MEB173 TaxID=3383345 RepID=UPI003F930BF1
MSSQQDKVYVEIIKAINKIIHEDQLKSGDKLPSERELSERLQVGRSSVREALRALELLDLIETRRGEGTFIKKAGGYRLVETLASFFLKHEKARKDLAETRRIVEVEALRLACDRITDEQLKQLKLLIDQSKKEWSQGDLPVDADYLFHKTIVEACDNRLLLYLWMPLVEYNKVSLEESLARDGMVDMWIAEHEQIYQAVVARDKELAVASLLEHLENSRF